MSPIPDDAARSGGIYHLCMQELQKPYPDYAMVQALATLGLAGNVAGGSWTGGRAQPPDHPRVKTVNRGQTARDHAEDSNPDTQDHNNVAEGKRPRKILFSRDSWLSSRHLHTR
jgi:hypothetical protein